MSSATLCKYEYRCARCFHSLYALTDEAGSEKPCPHCGTNVVLPEATPDRIARAEHLPDDVLHARPAVEASKPLTDAEMERQLKQQLYVHPSEMQCLTMIAASRVKRLIGAIIDGALVAIAGIAGFFLLLALISSGLISEAALKSKEWNLDTINGLCVIYFLPLAVTLCQWNGIAVYGQTLGKKLMSMKIVSEAGRSPGFLQGVVLRNRVRALLNFIPFFGLIDLLFIFGDAKRCVHDYIAGTHVVDV